MRVLVLAGCPAVGEVPDDGRGETAGGGVGDKVPASLQEWALLAAARRGDLGAFELLYRRNVKRVHALCGRLAADGAAAEELVQEVFVRAWGNLAGFRGECSFLSWLRQVALRLFLDDRRARLRGPLLLDDVHAAVLSQAGRSETGAQESRLDLERALHLLPPRARAIFVLHDIEGHKHEEIAALMNIDAGTSKSQLHRARRLLREALG